MVPAWGTCMAPALGACMEPAWGTCMKPTWAVLPLMDMPCTRGTRVAMRLGRPAGVGVSGTAPVLKPPHGASEESPPCAVAPPPTMPMARRNRAIACPRGSRPDNPGPSASTSAFPAFASAAAVRFRGGDADATA
eukprot:257716-Chlamydomonas_euryale.AAC.1